ncbi:hypothetical protein H0H87_009666 [Tephrocybe sp. NHM501043]|nr:hypothetical protein H0H87_009666 [Tephrocybe sp. NHM501043]
MDISELPIPPRQRSPSYYFALFGFVVPFCSTIPLAWAYVIYAVGSRQVHSLSWRTQIIFFLALSEVNDTPTINNKKYAQLESQVLFSAYQCYLIRLVSPPAPCGAGDLREIQAAFKRLLQSGLANLPADGGDEESRRPGSPEEDIIQLEFDDPRAIDFRNALRPWFGNAIWSSIKLHHAQQWLYWSIYNADMPPYESLSVSQQAVLASALDLLQKRCGCVFKEGSNGSIKTMRMTLDRVNITWRPFTFYLALYLINLSLKKWFQLFWHVRIGYHDGLEYLIRTPKHWDPVTGPRPLVFIHGLGMGLFQYSVVLQHLMRHFSDRPFLVLLQPQISQHIFHPRFLKPMTRYETAERLAILFAHLGWVHHNIEDYTDSEEEKEIAHSLVGKRKRGVTMLSHSNGSYVHAWMLKGHQKMIGRSCFVDPVTFCSWEGELGVANLLARHFDWASNTLWFEDIPDACDPNKAFFLLGGQDTIIRSERVKRYLTSHGVKQGLWFDPTGTHGQALRPGSAGHLEIIRWIREADT